MKNVVLPAPLGPISETIAFSGTVKLTSLTATRPPKILEIPLGLSSGAPFGGAGASWLRASLITSAPLVVRVSYMLASSNDLVGSMSWSPWSSSLRLVDGIRPSGRRTIIDEQQEAEDPEVDRGDVEVEPELVGRCSARAAGSG